MKQDEKTQMTVYNTVQTTHDGATPSAVVFNTETAGVSTDSSGERTIEWDSVETVTLQQGTDSVAQQKAFDTNEFYRLSATVARPIPQPYFVGGTDATDSQSTGDEYVAVLDAKHDYDVGDWVEWNFASGSAVGKVREKSTSEELSVEGGTRNATEDNPAYKIEHWDDDEFANMVVKRGSELTDTDVPSGTNDASMLSDLDLTPPETAQENAQQALEWIEAGKSDAMQETGRDRARQLASGESLSPEDIADGTDGMANWWARHEEHALSPDDSDNPAEDDGYVAGLGWGGETGMNWAMRMDEKIAEIRETNDATNVLWLKKPRAELQKAAWSLDNSPFTLGHPDSGLVQTINDVHGFWADTHYDVDKDALISNLYVPVNDGEAKSYLESTNDVSVGFQNRVTRVDEYDDVVGGEGPDVNADSDMTMTIDGYQTDILFDHVAAVDEGRCSEEDGCGIGVGTQLTGDSTYKGIVITNTDEDVDAGMSSVMTQQEQTEMADSKFVNEEDDVWYAVPPEDNPDDEWKFPITSCDGEDSVDSAWHFAIRERGDISISFATLKERIRRKANELDCDMELEDASSDAVADITNSDTMTDCGCNDGGMNVSFDDLSPEVALDKIAAENDQMASHLDDLRQKARVADDVSTELDTDIEQVADRAALLDERVDELQETVDELQRPKMREDAEAIIEVTDRYGESVDDVLEAFDEDADEIAEKRNLVEDLADGYTSQKTASNDSADSTDSPGANGIGHGSDEYVATPWD